MKGTEKQIAYAQNLLEQFKAPLLADIQTQEKMIAAYRDRMASGDPRDYSAQIEKRQQRIDHNNTLIERAEAITDAGELIGAIKYGRASLRIG